MSHIVSKKVYFTIFGLLLVFTAITVAASRVNIGRWNIVLALTIAVTKATLVMLYFMHLRYSSRLMRLVAGAGVFWLFLMISITMSDYISRGHLSFPGGW